MWLFVCAAICAAPVQQLDELVLGEWTILATEFMTKNASDSNLSYYSVIIEETHDQGVFAGKIYLREGEEDATLLDTLKLAFDHGNKAHVTLSMGEDSVQITDVIFNETGNGLRVAIGELDVPTTTFSISIFSYKAIELIVMDAITNRVTIYRMLRAVNDGKGSGQGTGGMFQYLPIILIAYFLFGKKKNVQNAEAPQEAPAAQEGDEPEAKGETE